MKQMIDATVENSPDSDLRDCKNKEKTTEISGQPMSIGATCTKCGLDVSLPLTGTKFFCQNCHRADDPHQDGDPCSELNPF
jgi:hypothetical protein